VRIAAGEALAVIFEVGDFERFAGEGGDSSDCAREGYLHLKGLKGKVLKQVRDLASEAGGKGAAKKDLNNQRNLFRDLLDFLEVLFHMHLLFSCFLCLFCGNGLAFFALLGWLFS